MLKSYRELLVWQRALKELETHVIISERLGFSSTTEADEVLAESEVVGKMLGGLLRSLRAKV